MDLLKVKPQDIRDSILEGFFTCSLCGEQLKFSHKVDHATRQVTEHSECPCCGIKNKTKDHSLQ